MRVWANFAKRTPVSFGMLRLAEIIRLSLDESLVEDDNQVRGRSSTQS